MIFILLLDLPPSCGVNLFDKHSPTSFGVYHITKCFMKLFYITNINDK